MKCYLKPMYLVLKLTSQSHNTKYREHASQENEKKVMQIFPTRMCNVTA